MADELSLILDLARQNAEHIRVINGEMNSIYQRLSVVETKIDMIFFLVLGLASKVALDLIGALKGKLNNRK